MSIKKFSGIKRIMYAAYYSWKGVRHSLVNESAFRQEVVLALMLIPLAFWVEVSMLERLLMISSVLLVMIVELLNTAIEATVDRIGNEFNELSGIAKDAGSAAVFICLLLCVFVWGGVLLV